MPMLMRNLLQDQWLMLAVGGGLVLILLVVLSYLAWWRPRVEPDVSAEGESTPLPGFLAHGVAICPWILLFTYVATIIYGVIYTIAKAVNPPNW